MKYSGASVSSGRVEITPMSMFQIVLFTYLAVDYSIAAVRVFRVPFPVGSSVVASDILVGVPFTKLDQSWESFSKKTNKNEYEEVLHELLVAVNRKDLDIVRTRVARAEPFVDRAAAQQYISAFSASLERFGPFDVEGYMSLKGRIRFVLRSTTGDHSRRLLSFTRDGAGKLRFNEAAPNRTDAVLNSVFLHLPRLDLELSQMPPSGYTFVPLESQFGVDVVLGVRAQYLDRSLPEFVGQPTAPVMEFYKRCFSGDKILDLYLACLQPDSRAQLQSGLAKMEAPKRDEFLKFLSSPRHVEYTIAAGAATLLYYRSNLHTIRSRDIVIHEQRNRFHLLDPMISFPIDELLSSKSVRDDLTAALRGKRK